MESRGKLLTFFNVDISSKPVKVALLGDLLSDSGLVREGRLLSGQQHQTTGEDDIMQKQKPLAKLENWAVVLRGHVADYQELRAGNLLVGKVFGHPRMEEGAFIFTSPIVSLDSKTNVVETRNTAYRLGEASREYKNWTRDSNGAAA